MLKKRIIPTDLVAARQLAQEVVGRLEERGFEEELCFAVRLALEEALSNAIKHGNRSDPHKRIMVSACIDDDGAAITVADEGNGFDPASVPDPTADENLEKPCGRGIMLMRAYMDKVEYNDRGNEVRIIKHRS